MYPPRHKLQVSESSTKPNHDQILSHDLYNAPTSMEFQSLMDSKSPSSGHTFLVDLISSSTLTPLLLCFVPVGSDNPSKCFELFD